MERIAIFGPGLIGGSIALALRTRWPNYHLTIWERTDSQFEEIVRRGLADTVETDPILAAREADLIILCTPVEAMTGLATLIASHLKENAIVTDAGSVKACVVDQLIPLLGSHFVGGHPMAGSERSGLAAARADLFKNAPCILTPVPETSSASLKIVTEFWNSLGAQITTMSPGDHDRLVARLSHLPHAVAFALVNLASATLPEGSLLLAGGSFRDGTRVASSDPALWTGILSENRREVVSALREMSDILLTLSDTLEKQEKSTILDFITRARDHRAHLPLPSPEELL